MNEEEFAEKFLKSLESNNDKIIDIMNYQNIIAERMRNHGSLIACGIYEAMEYYRIIIK